MQVLSDLHLQSPFAYDIFTIPPSAAHLALLGDIGNARDAGFFDFLGAQLKAFTTVFLVLGNHEPYHSDWAQAKQKTVDLQNNVRERRRQGESVGDFVLLDQTRYNLSWDVTVLGCMRFSSILPEQRHHVGFGLNDFYRIRHWTTEQHDLAHASDLRWLNEQVAAIEAVEPHRRIVCLTHCSPSTDAGATDPAHVGSNISSGFVTHLSHEPC